MTDWLFTAFMALPIGYIVFYIWALIFRIIPWMNIALTEIFKLTLLQIVATFLFFTGGLWLFIICLIFVLGVSLDL